MANEIKAYKVKCFQCKHEFVIPMYYFNESDTVWLICDKCLKSFWITKE